MTRSMTRQNKRCVDPAYEMPRKKSRRVLVDYYTDRKPMDKYMIVYLFTITMIFSLILFVYAMVFSLIDDIVIEKTNDKYIASFICIFTVFSAILIGFIVA